MDKLTTRKLADTAIRINENIRRARHGPMNQNASLQVAPRVTSVASAALTRARKLDALDSKHEKASFRFSVLCNAMSNAVARFIDAVVVTSGLDDLITDGLLAYENKLQHTLYLLPAVNNV
jgi:hypothetical protein